MISRDDRRRRRFLQAGLSTLAGAALPTSAPALAAQPTPRASSCILLYMDGGPSHIDMFDLKPHAPAEIRGPMQSIATGVPGTRVCELLPRVAAQMRHIVQVRSMRHEEMVHDPAVYQMLTGYRHVSSAGGLKVEPTDMPHMGSAFAQADPTRTALPKSIHLPDLMKMQGRVLPGQNAGILPAAFDSFQVDLSHAGEVTRPHFALNENLTPHRLRRRERLLARLSDGPRRVADSDETRRLTMFRNQAVDILSNPSIEQAFDLDREPRPTHERYGRHRQGQSTLLARRLVEAGARFVTVYWGNEEQDWADGKGQRLANNPWDTHRNHFPLIADSLIPRADQTLSALLEDLHERGLLEETLVVWMGDFGRTPRIDKRWASRDHWPHAFTVLLAGAGARGGDVYGQTDRYAEEVTDRPHSPADLTATLFDALGIQPHIQVKAADGSPHRLSAGRPIRGLFA